MHTLGMVEVNRLDASDRRGLALVVELVRREFAYMHGLVDPPSSVLQLSVDVLATPPSEVWVIGSPPRACVVATPRPEVLYLGKMAVQSAERGMGHSRRLVEQADRRARELGLPWLELECRIELVENHLTFAALGFEEVGRTAHDGFDRPTSITFRRRVPVG